MAKQSNKSRISSTPLPSCCPSDAIREELRCMLTHPAIAVERRCSAEVFLTQCLDVAKLLRWQQLVLQECAQWEDEALAIEKTQRRESD